MKLERAGLTPATVIEAATVDEDADAEEAIFANAYAAKRALVGCRAPFFVYEPRPVFRMQNSG